MQEELQRRLAAYLAAHRVAVVSTGGSSDSSAMPAIYRASGLELDLMLPQWADVAFGLERDPRALLVVVCGWGRAMRWLEYRGLATRSRDPDWEGLLPPDQPPARAGWLYHLFHLTPSRIDLLDESGGWGSRETLDL